MIATIYTPIDPASNKNWTDAESAQVEVESTVDALLEALEAGGAPDGLRVVIHHRGTTHYLYTRKQWKCVLRVIQ